MSSPSISGYLLQHSSLRAPSAGGGDGLMSLAPATYDVVWSTSPTLLIRGARCRMAIAPTLRRAASLSLVLELPEPPLQAERMSTLARSCRFTDASGGTCSASRAPEPSARNACALG